MVPQNSLGNTVLGAGLRPDQLGVLEEHAELKSFADKEPIVTKQDSTFPILLLLSGQAEVLGLFGEVVNVIKPGSLLGEVSFLDRLPRTADVLSKGASQVAAFSEDVIAWLNVEHPDIVAQLLYTIGRQLCDKLRTAQRIIDASDTAASAGRLT